MTWSPYPSCWVASAALIACCAPPTDAPAGSPGLQITGDSVKLRPGETARSAVFDGREVHLRGARGEVLGIVVWPDTADDQPISLDLADRRLRVSAFGVHRVDVREPSTAMYGPSRGAGAYPDALVPVDGAVDGADAAFFDVAISSEAAPGLHFGWLSAGRRRIPVTVRVAAATIDLRSSPRVWAYYEPREVARVHGVPAGSEQQLAWERRYAALFRAHGVYLSTDLSRDDVATRGELLAGVRYWPVWIDTRSREATAADVSFWVERLRDRGVTPFAIPIDEPRRMRDRLQVRSIGRAVDEVAPDPSSFALAVTDSPGPLYGDAVDVFISPDALTSDRTATAGPARRWTYNGRPPRAGSMIIDTDGVALRTWGWIGYRYDVELWYAWEALYFRDRYNGGRDRDPTDPLTFDQRRSGGEDYGNGDGLLAYPGALPSLRLKALRRGLQDRKLLETLDACGGRAEAKLLAARIIPAALGDAPSGGPRWPTDEPVWERARSDLLDAVVRRCSDVL